MPQNITIRTQRPYVDPMPFQLPQFSTPSDQVNQAGSEAVKDIKSYADPLSGAKLNLSLPNQGKGEWWKQTGDVNAGNSGQALNTAFGLSDQTRPVLSDRGQASIPQAPQVNTALPSNDSHIPATTTNEKETNDVHPDNIAWGQNKEAADYIRNSTNPSQTMREIQMNNAAADLWRKQIATEPVHGGRKIAAILTGIATGVLGGGIPGGIGAYQQVAHGPSLKNLGLVEARRKDLIEQEKLQETEFGRAVQQGSAMASVARTSADIMKAQNEEERLKQEPLDKVEFTTEEGQKGVQMVGSRTGKPTSAFIIGASGQPEDLTKAEGFVDGKPVTAFTSKKGKIYVNGKQVTSGTGPGQFYPHVPPETKPEKELPPEVAAFVRGTIGEKNWADYKAEKATAFPIVSKAIEQYRTQVATKVFGMQNPGGDVNTVKWIADQVEADPTGQQFSKLTAQDRTLQHQVRLELQSRDADIRTLTSATRQLGETAHELMPNINETIKTLEDPKVIAAMGPLGSRWQEFIAGQIGSSDPALRGVDAATVTKLNRLRVFMGLDQTGVARAHIGARGSPTLQSKFENLFNASKMDAKTAKDSITAARDFLKTYENAVYKDKGKKATAGEIRVTMPNGDVNIFDSDKKYLRTEKK